MSRIRLIPMLAVSLVSGLAAIVLAARWLTEQGNLATQPVAVAILETSAGVELSADHVRLVDWPRAAVPAGAISSVEALKSRVTRADLARDEPILESKLAPMGARAGLSALITRGKRAISVRVNDVIGVAGFVLPGSYVDVILSTESAAHGKEDSRISKIVLENILVLATGEDAGRDETRPRDVKAVTLEVTPVEAEAIDLARSVGQLSLVLRNQVDKEPANSPGVTKDRLLAVERVAAKLERREPVAVTRAADCVELFSGREVGRKCFH